MKTKTQKLLRVLIFLVAMLGLVACQNGGDQNSNNMPAPATTYTKTPTPLPSPTSLPPTATPTMIPPEFVPRYMLLSPPYFSTMLLGTQCNYQKDSWNKQSAYMAYACPDLDVPWLSVRFSTLEEGQTAFDLFGKKPGEGSVLIPSGELFSEYKNLTISGRIENTEYAYFMLYETDQFVISAEAFFPEDTSNTLETFFPGKGDVVLNAVLETILGKANNIISPPEPTPMASDQQMMHGQISDWLVTEKEATDFYQGATDMFGDSFDGTWLSLGDDVDIQRESICREFVDWTNEDAPLVRFFNCIYYVGPDYDLEHILTDRPYAISLKSAFEYPKQHLIFVHDNGRYTALSAFILQDDFLFYFSLSSRSLVGQTAEDVFTEFNDRFIYNVMMTNLDRFSLENVNYFSTYVYDDPSPTPTQTQTPTLTTTPTKKPTRTKTPTPTITPTKTPTRTRTPSPTASPTKKPTSTKIVDLLPSNACAPGESLIYIEDFQDGSADGWPTIGGQEIPWSIVPDPYTAGNIVVKRVVDQDSSATLEGYIFENAVWRAQFMPIGSPIFNFAWHWHGGGYKVDGVTVDWSSYTIWFHPPGLRTFRAQPPISTDMLRNINQTMESDVWHQLEIGTFEGVLDIWIDGTRFLSYQDPNPLPAGKVVLGTVYDEALGTVSTVYFDDLVICELTKPFDPMPTSEP